jgi:hypothetical protein
MNNWQKRKRAELCKIREEEARTLDRLTEQWFGTSPFLAEQVWRQVMDMEEIPVELRRFGKLVAVGRRLSTSELFCKVNLTSRGWLWTRTAVVRRQRQEADEAMFD